jgi:3-keto-disaccharide hydrolase
MKFIRRFILIIVGASGFACAPAQEDDANWRPLLDGKNLDGWDIEGEHEFADGVLNLGGGARQTRAFLPLKRFRNSEIRFQFQLHGNKDASIGFSVQGELRKPNPGIAIPHLTPTDEWQDAFLEEYWDLRHFQQYMVNGPRGMNGISRPIQSVWFEVPAGAKLRIRNLRIRDGDDSWLLIVGIPLVFAVIVGAAYWWWKRKQRIRAAKSIREHVS